MSEAQTRGSSTRGRGGFRGGRGGYRGSRGGKPHSSRDEQENGPPLEDQGEVGELKSKYADKLPMMREICEGWSDEDLVFALQETNGDEGAAMDRITSGNISQWGQVKKKVSKPKETTAATDATIRGRGRGGLESRGRGRGANTGTGTGTAERGVRGGRGARSVSHANGTKHTDKAATSTDDGWGAPVAATNGDAIAHAEDWANDSGKDKLASLETDKPQPAASAVPVAAAGKSGGWASLFARPAAAPPSAHKMEPTSAAHVEETGQPDIPTSEPEDAAPASAPEPAAEETYPAPPPIEPLVLDDAPSELPSAPHSDIATNDLAPAADELTKENVNKLPDASNPIASMTVASTAASTQDPMNPALPHVQAIRPGMSGHAASALRATTGAGRSASYSRKVMDQQEAVVMPGNHAVDRAAVQFGKMGLDSDDADADADADEDREEPETRTQLPDDSPSAPRASLPPAPANTEPQLPPPPAVAEPPTEPQSQRPPSGLPSALQAVQDPSPPQPSSYPDQYRYTQGQKPYDPFSHQSHQSQHQQGPGEPFSNQLPGQAQAQGPPTTQQEAYQQYYGREYASYYGYGQSQGQGQGQEQQRGATTYGTSAQDTPAQYASAGSRNYGSQDLAASGHNTPNPHTATHQTQQSAHMQHGPNAQAGYQYGQYGQGYGSGYPQYAQYGSMGQNAAHASNRYGANRPMFDDARRQGQQQQHHQQQESGYYDNNQYAYGHNQGYSGSYGKSGMYGAGPQHQYSHDYSSPGNAAFGGRDGYGRAGSTQPADGQQTASSGSNAYAGSMQDPFGRTPSGFGHSQHGAHASEDPAKPTGPSPSLQGGRPGSAAQGVAGQQQSGLPHSQGGQQAFSGYPQYQGFGNNQHSGYGSYGSNNAFGGYGAAYGRGGWANQQQYGSGQH